MSEARIDIQVEHKHAPAGADKEHPNTCPKCGSHYRDDELASTLQVCPQCGHHFPMHARARIEWYADEGSFTEESAGVRSDDPLAFFDLRPYAERLVEAGGQLRLVYHIGVNRYRGLESLEMRIEYLEAIAGT